MLPNDIKAGEVKAALNIGDTVTIEARIVGHSTFEVGADSYLCEFTKCGRTERSWFKSGDLQEDGDV